MELDNVFSQERRPLSHDMEILLLVGTCPRPGACKLITGLSSLDALALNTGTKWRTNMTNESELLYLEVSPPAAFSFLNSNSPARGIAQEAAVAVNGSGAAFYWQASERTKYKGAAAAAPLRLHSNNNERLRRTRTIL